MRQYFYLIGHSVVGDDFCMDKVFMQKSDAISYGKHLLRKNSEYTVSLYRQPISNSSNDTIEYVRDIVSAPIKPSDPIKPSAPIEPFDWGAYDTL